MNDDELRSWAALGRKCFEMDHGGEMAELEARRKSGLAAAGVVRGAPQPDGVWLTRAVYNDFAAARAELAAERANGMDVAARLDAMNEHNLDVLSDTRAELAALQQRIGALADEADEREGVYDYGFPSAVDLRAALAGATSPAEPNETEDAQGFHSAAENVTPDDGETIVRGER